MPTRLLLVRHGQINWTGLIGAPTDGLNDTGRQQAHAAAVRVSRMNPAALYSSTLPRALQTAEIIGATTGLEVIREAGLREWHPGDWFGLDEATLKAKHPEVWTRMETDFSFVFPGGEIVAQLRERAASTVHRIVALNPDRVVALVTHGGWLSNFAWHVLEVDPDVQVERGYHRGWQPFNFEYCSLTIIDVLKGRPALVTLNDTSHLDGPAA